MTFVLTEAHFTTEAGTVHREAGPGYRSVIGLSVDVAAMTQPVNKPLPVS